MKANYPDGRILDVQQARTAANRFRGYRFPERDARRSGPTTAVPAAAVNDDRRKEYLKASLTHERVRATVAEAESRGAPRSAAETLASLAHERILGSNDLRDLNYLEVAIAVARAVCRVRVGPGSGSGVLVGPRLLMTNHHVISSPQEAHNAEAQFDYQENVSGDLLPVHAYRCDPETFFFTDPQLDVSIVGLAPNSARGQPIDRYPWMPLIATLGKAEAGDPLNIIQHPRGGLKQIALRNNQVIIIPDGKPDFLYYTTDTEPGSSGSPCFNDQWEVIALHHSGVPRMDGDRILRKDGKPWNEGDDDPALIDWIANEGARVSAIIDALRAASLNPAHRDLVDAALGGTAPNPVELAREDIAPRVVPAVTASVEQKGGAVSFTVPLTITVSVGNAPGTAVSIAAGTASFAAPTATSPAATLAPPDLVQEKLVVDPDWSTRKGYDAHFLDVSVPLPVLSATQQANSVVVPAAHRVNGDRFVLAYHHYSLAMNRRRRFAWYSAANIDGKVRPVLPERKDDEWFIDPRIDDPAQPKFQLGEALYATANTDRGHLTRYLDVAWGSRKQALDALADTFHFTNACLQLSAFNQRQSRWQGIEQFLLERKANRDKMRISVFTGPLFRANDPWYQNRFMDAPVRIPLEFWKICALVRDDGTLSATAFILSQDDITALPGFEAFLDVAAVQTTIANVEKRTGLRFPVLRDNDHLAGGGTAGTLELEGQTVIPIRSFEDIVA